MFLNAESGLEEKEELMQTLKVLIVEDEPLIADDIKGLMLDWGYEVVGCAVSSHEALQLFEAYSPDLAIVDVNLRNGDDGIETVKQMNVIHRIPIVYLTAQADSLTVDRAKETKPSSYLLKPFDERNLHISVELALSNFLAPIETHKLKEKEVLFAHESKLTSDVILKQGDTIFIKQNYRFVKLKMEDFVYIEADRNHSYLVMKQQRYIIRLPLAIVLERLDESYFVRVHRSYAINMRFVEEFDDNEVVVNKKAIPITATYREEFLKQFNIL